MLHQHVFSKASTAATIRSKTTAGEEIQRYTARRDSLTLAKNINFYLFMSPQQNRHLKSWSSGFFFTKDYFGNW